MASNYKIIDISQIKKIPSLTEVPVTRGHPTLRSLCANSPENRDILKKMEALKGMWEIVTDPKFEQCLNSLFPKDYIGLVGIEKLKKELTELMIRFDTNPQNYTKQDFDHLIKVICGSLVHIYTILAAWGNLISTDEDVLQVQMFDDHIEWRPQVGTLTGVDMRKQEDLPDKEDKNERAVARVGNIREYIENRLTWLTEQDLK